MTLSRRRFFQSTAAVAVFAGLPWPAFAAGAELIVRQADPYNAEPALSNLIADAITPVKHFYVRSHGPVPERVPDKIAIDGLVNKPGESSVDEIRGRFKSLTTTATLTCAGNRRQEMNRVKPVPGVQWDAGAIGTAQWTGASLAEVLRAAELKPDAKHVWFEGYDPIKEKDGSVAPFGGSIPLDKALAADTPALLAHAMNDAPLTAEHGAPLRTVVPGYIGARSVKWLAKITVSDRPSPNHYIAEAYKLVQTDDKPSQAAAEPIYAFGVNAAICSPPADKRLAAGRVTIAGYALPTGEPNCTVAKVELSADGGRSWSEAGLKGRPQAYAWQLWSADVELAAGRHELVVRATDSRGHMMPKDPAWNAKGYLHNAWHRVSIEVAG
jgi:sulfite oxidase